MAQVTAKAPGPLLAPLATRDGQHEGGAEAEVAVAEVRRVGVAAGAAGVAGDVAPTSAAHREAALGIAVNGVRDRFLREGSITGRAELPDVAEHVAQAESVGLIGADGGEEGMAVVHRHDLTRPVRVHPLQAL